MLEPNPHEDVVEEDLRRDGHETVGIGRRRWMFIAAFACVGIAVVVLLAVMLRPSGDQGGGDSLGLASPRLTDDVLAAVDASSTEVAEAVVGDLLPDGGTPVDAATVDEVVTSLAVLIDPTIGTSEEPADAEAVVQAADLVVDGFVRRLGAAASDAESLEELSGLLVAQIDPEGTVDTVEAAERAASDWLEATSAISITVGGGEQPALTAGGFDDAVRLLEATGLRAGAWSLPVPGIDGVTDLALGGITWAAEDRSQTISFSGSTTYGGGASDAVVTVTWTSTAEPEVTAAVRFDDWSLANAGVDGTLGEQRLGPVTVVIASGSGATVNEIDGFIRSAHAIGSDLLEPIPGVSVVGGLPTSALSAVGRTLIDGDTDPVVGFSASLGVDAGAIAGSARPDRIVITADAPVTVADVLPTWAQSTDDAGWRLRLTIESGTTTVELGGTVEVELGGGSATFETAISTDTESATGTGTLVDPISRAFGIDWLDLDTAVLTVGPAGASISGDGRAAGRDVTAMFTVDDVGQVAVDVALDRLTSDEVADFVAGAVGASLPDIGDGLVFDGVTISARSGDAASFALASTVEILGQPVQAMVSAARLGGESGVVLGARVGQWSLGDAVPALRDTVVGDVAFPPTTMIVASVDGRLRADEMTAAQSEFFGTGDVDVRRGVAIDTRIDLADTALERPLDALGFAGGSLPVTGTIPASLFGGSDSGATSGASILDDLALRIGLPAIDKGDAPEWIRGGRAAIEIGGAAVGLAGQLDVVIEDDELTFDVTAGFARQGPGYAMSITGALADGEPWDSPFGLNWLSFDRVIADVSVQPTGTVGLGFAGTATIAGRDLDAAMAVELTAAGVPTNVILSGASEAGFSTNDVLLIQRALADEAGLPAAEGGDRYPALAVRNAEIRFAPRASETLGVEQGFVLAGDAFLAARGAEQALGELAVRASEDGMFASGRIAGYRLGPLQWSDVELDLVLSPAQQRLLFDGSVDLFGIDVDVEIDVSNDSVFFSDAVDEIARIVDLFEELVRDPAGALDQIASLYRDTGAPVPEWVDDLLGAVDVAVAGGAELTDAAVDTALSGGRLALKELPAGGADPVCPISAQFEEDGVCYRTPTTPAVEGLPSGGVEERCPSWAPRKQRGDCYSLLPDPCGPLEVVCDPDGTPNGGTDTVCGVETPFKDDGRCYTTPPIPSVPAQPPDGVERVCPVEAPFEDGGRCYVVTPSAASAGVDLPGICDVFDIPCSVRELVTVEIARELADTMADRLTDW